MDEPDVVTEIPGVSNTVIGELASRTPTEVGMEGFFGICGHVSDARRLMQEIRLYERLVIGKHRLQRIYLSRDKIKSRFMERFKNNSWDEKEERENLEYLETEKDIWLEECPIMAARLFQEEEDDNEESDIEDVAGSDLDESGDDSGSKSDSDDSSVRSAMSEDADDVVRRVAGNVYSPVAQST